MLRISNIKLFLEEEETALLQKAAKKLRIPPEEILSFKIFRKSLDARKKEAIHFLYTLDVTVQMEAKLLRANKNPDITKAIHYQYCFPAKKTAFKHRPVIIGFGPAGIFAALLLAEMGYAPLVLEQGKPVEERTKDVEAFWKSGILVPSSNVQFGEGGAGTFSDGKLTTRIKDSRCRKVLEELTSAGADPDILYDAKPHIGTDQLKSVVKALRQKIIALGGEIRFHSCVTDFIIENNTLTSLIVNGTETIPCEAVALAIGHSARNTFETLYQKGIPLEQKSFAMGVRIEHLQTDINTAQYGKQSSNPKLKAADYRLTYTTKEGKGVYTFCMCPGGYVVAAASEAGKLAVNGMSYHARHGDNSNSALLVQVSPEDFADSHPLAGMYLQQALEEKAFKRGGCSYFAPAQLVDDFLNNVPSIGYRSIRPTYEPGVTWTNINTLLPPFITDALKEAIPAMGKRLKGFDHADAILTAVESRSSSPVRIVRSSFTGESTQIKGLYPTGEGAGYAGGIVSAAVDGIYIAEKIVDNSPSA